MLPCCQEVEELPLALALLVGFDALHDRRGLAAMGDDHRGERLPELVEGPGGVLPEVGNRDDRGHFGHHARPVRRPVKGALAGQSRARLGGNFLRVFTEVRGNFVGAPGTGVRRDRSARGRDRAGATRDPIENFRTGRDTPETEAFWSETDRDGPEAVWESPEAKRGGPEPDRVTSETERDGLEIDRFGSAMLAFESETDRDESEANRDESEFPWASSEANRDEPEAGCVNRETGRDWLEIDRFRSG